MNNPHDNDQSSSHSGDASNMHKMHAHWRAKFSAEQKKQIIETSNSSSAVPMLAPENQSDKALGYHYHDLSVPENLKNFDQKIYLFPPAFNALRRELNDNWPVLWALSSWYMAYRAEEFCAIMNDATDLRIIFDSGAVNWMCEQWLNKLIKMRMK